MKSPSSWTPSTALPEMRYALPASHTQPHRLLPLSSSLALSHSPHCCRLVRMRPRSVFVTHRMLVMMVYTAVQQPLFRVALGRHAVPAGAPFVPDHAALQVPQTHAAGQGICRGEQSGLPHHKRVGAAQEERRQLPARRHVGARAGCQGLAAGDTKEGYHQHHCLGIQVSGSL